MDAEEGLPSSEARSHCWKGLCTSHCSPLPSLSPQNRAVPVPTSPRRCLWEQGGHPNRAGFFHRLFQPQAWISSAKPTSICSLPPAQRSVLGSPSCRLSPNLALRMLRGCCQGILPPAQQRGSSRTLYPPSPAAYGDTSFHLQQDKQRRLLRAPRMQSVPTTTERQLFSSRNSAQIKHGINTWTPAQQHSCSSFPSCLPPNLEDHFINVVGCYQMERRGMPRTDHWLLVKLRGTH